MRDARLAAVLAGAATGARSMGALALLGRRGLLEETAWGGPWTTRLLTLAAVGEAVADKTIDLPSRTEVLPLAARTVIGGLIGNLGARRSGGSTALPTLLGAAAAAAGATLFTRLRAALTEQGAPDLGIALLEEGAVVGLSGAAGDLLELD